jgi:hypothetical protein
LHEPEKALLNEAPPTQDEAPAEGTTSPLRRYQFSARR